MSTVAGIVFVAVTSPAMAGDVYGPYPITLKGYNGDKTNSVSYSGQIGRQLLHNSLKKAIGSGASLDVTMSYFNGADGELVLLDPKSSDSFKVDITDINTVSKTNLSGKAYKGSLPGWPGNMTGKEALESMIPIYPIEASVLPHITDWFAIFMSTFFIGLVIVDYFAWCISCSKQLKKQASEIPHDAYLVFTVF